MGDKKNPTSATVANTAAQQTEASDQKAAEDGQGKLSFFQKIKNRIGRNDGRTGSISGVVYDMNKNLKCAISVGFIILLLIILFPSLQVFYPFLFPDSSLHNSNGNGHPIVLLMIAAAAFGGGIFFGLIMTAFGEEKQMFGSLSAALNGVIGGFTIADLTKNDSVIKKVLHGLAAASGDPKDIGLTGAVIMFFGAAGFVTMFFNKQYVLNPLLAKSQQTNEQLEKLARLTKNLQTSDFSWESKIEITDDQKLNLEKAVEFFNGVLEDDQLISSVSPETLRSYAKACRLLAERAENAAQPDEALKRFQQAERILRRARNKAPDDGGLLMELSNVLLMEPGREYLAAPYCSNIVHQPSPPVSAYKLLGYAGLFDYRYLAEAEVATTTYLKIFPNDAGAKLNLACAIAQQDAPGKITDERRQKLYANLKEAICDWSEARERAVKLTEDDQDFMKWRDDAEFKKITAATNPQ